MHSEPLTDEEISELLEEAESVVSSDSDKALKTLEPLVKAQRSQRNAADALVYFIRKDYLPFEIGLDILSGVYDVYKNDREIIVSIGSALEAVRDLDDLNSSPPEHPLFSNVIKQLLEIAIACKGQDGESDIAESLSSAARLMGHQFDDLADKYYTRLVELLPNEPWPHYNQGLFFKTRGRFSEGVAANQKAIKLSDEDKEQNQWNLGICATGAGHADIALKVWQNMGQNIEMGRFNLPEGKYPSCKVRLAERPLAERDAKNDDPGLEETIWIERLSPCHGIIRSVLYNSLGIDYGDVILFDGAPITSHRYGKQNIPIMPHLATLIRSNYQFYNFVGTQENAGELNGLDKNFENDVVIYSHTENYQTLCSACWKDETLDHKSHKNTVDKHVVIGRIAAPANLAPSDLIKQIDAALKGKPHNRIFTPDLCRAADLSDRTIIEERRYKLLCDEV